MSSEEEDSLERSYQSRALSVASSKKQVRISEPVSKDPSSFRPILKGSTAKLP